jgi:hypothetical protein
MAKGDNKLTVVEPPKNEVVDLANDLLTELVHDSGSGLSKKLEDNVLPLVKYLQTGSPECAKRTPTYIEGAEAGDFLFKNAETPVVSGETGFLFQPLAYQRAWVEWKPNRGGYAGQHADLPDDAKEMVEVNPEDGKERRVMGLPNGNYLEETAYYYGLTEDHSLWVMPFRSSGLSVARNWMTALNNTKLQVNDPAKGLRYLDLPIWGSIWRVTSAVMSNPEHTWFVPAFKRVSKFGEPGFTVEVYREAKAKAINLQEQLASGEKVVEAMAQEEPPPASNGAGGGGARSMSEEVPRGTINEDIPF